MSCGVRHGDAWSVGLSTAGGAVAEANTPAGAPWATLIFLNIRRSGTPEGPPCSLHVPQLVSEVHDAVMELCTSRAGAS